MSSRPRRSLNATTPDMVPIIYRAATANPRPSCPRQPRFLEGEARSLCRHRRIQSANVPAVTCHWIHQLDPHATAGRDHMVYGQREGLHTNPRNTAARGGSRNMRGPLVPSKTQPLRIISGSWSLGPAEASGPALTPWFGLWSWMQGCCTPPITLSRGRRRPRARGRVVKRDGSLLIS